MIKISNDVIHNDYILMHTEIEQFNLGQYLNWVSAILFKRNYCQAQPQPTPANMSWESNIITTPGNQSTPYTFTHPVRIVVSPCSLHVNYLVLNNSWLVHHLMTCWWLAHDLFTICSLFVHHLYTSYSWLVLGLVCSFFAWVVGVPVGRCSGRQLATM